MAMNSLPMIIALLIALPLSACSLSDGPIEGRVLEEGTDKPIPGAIVIVRWIGRTTSGSMFVEARDVCYHVETAETDENGGYQIKAWSQEQHKDYTVTFDQMAVDAYKPGYGFSSAVPRNDEDMYLDPFKGTGPERLIYLKRMFGATGCDAQNESRKNMLPFLNALYAEAKAYRGDKKPVPNEMSFTESILYDIEIIELGFEEAEKRHLQRP